MTDADPHALYVQTQKAFEAENAAKEGWTTTASGLQYKPVVEVDESQPKPDPSATVTIHYTGTFIDGRAFDSSRTRGEPATFPLNRLIRGWQEGVPLMRVGERFEFVIPADIAYGNNSRPPIPPGSTLLFDIELIAIDGVA
jgi:FKBP-type peptidyl-prolyl cis-trans isomerase FkpA